ncbi:MAG: lactate utilization protein B [Thermoproteota archaeon]
MTTNWKASLEVAIKNNINKVSKILNNYSYIENLSSKLREIKLKVIENLEYYLDKCKESIEKNGGNFYFVRNSQEAHKILFNLVGKNKKIIMSKTINAHEIGVIEYLTSLGNEVIESDLGEFLVQIANEKPFHILAPALHMSKEKVAELLREKLNLQVDKNSSIEDLVRLVREYMRDKFTQADIGITGANAIAADTGSIILVENEGNARITSSFPSTHIVVAGVEKIVPTFQDARIQAIVQSAYAGFFPPAYISVISSPSFTGDIELRRVSPSHGPKQLNVILVDNGRIKASKDEILKEALLCIRCGRCHFHCPVYKEYGEDWGHSPYNGPMGAMWSYLVFNDLQPANFVKDSSECLECMEVCPLKINIPKIIDYIKNKKS